MDIVRKNVGGTVYTFYNTFRGNYSGFVHETELVRNDYWVIGRNKIQYYNRTWERYTYQSVMKGLVHDLMEDFMEEYKTEWKNSHGIKRLTKQKNEVMMEDFQNNTPKEYVELKELYNML